MSQEDKIVVYYSCFNYQIDSQDFSHIEPLRTSAFNQLGQQWLAAIQRELELLNISLSKYPIELCCEVYFSLISQYPEHTYSIFREIFITELLLSNIWTSENPELLVLDELLQAFYSAACNSMLETFSNEYKLLPSRQQQPYLQPLVVAEEAVTTMSEKICRVLKKVSLPLESLLGPENTSKIASYIKCLSSRVIRNHQVTSSFATNIIEIKPKTSNLKVRVIQPAKEFYDKVLDSWLSNGENSNSTSFLIDLKQKIGIDWNERLVCPALCFFEIAKEEWGKAKDIGYNYFLRKMQERMVEMWRQAIVETSKTFQEHMLTKTII